MGQEAEGADRRAIGATAPVGPTAPSGALKVIQNGTRRLALCAPASATQPAETGFSLQTCGLELSPSLQPSAVPCWGKGTLAGNCSEQEYSRGSWGVGWGHPGRTGPNLLQVIILVALCSTTPPWGP